MSSLPTKSSFDTLTNMGLLRSQTSGTGLTIYCYNEFTQFQRLWNTTTLAARGIVFDDEGEIVQRCLPKFFNSDEPDGIITAKVNEPTANIIQNKLDGSLIKVSFSKKHGLVVTSKCSFASKQVGWAKEIIADKKYKDLFEPGYTYHFELIHPENQIVLNYGYKKALVLFAIVKNENGKEPSIYESELAVKFEKAEKLTSKDVLNIIRDNNEGVDTSDKPLSEGVVVNYGTYRLKIKTAEYVRIHRIVSNLTENNVWQALASKQPISRENIPEEFVKWLEVTQRNLLIKYCDFFDDVSQALADTQHMSNKEVGLSDNPMKPYIFASRSGKDLEAMVWKAVKPKGE